MACIQQMKWMRWTGLLLVLSVQGCTLLDDYWLGKDNTAMPEPLPTVTSSVKWTPCWTVSLGKSSINDTYLRLKPALDDGMIYAAGHQGMVKAIDQTTGAVRWAKQQTRKLVSGPAVGKKQLVFATNDAGILVVDKYNGNELWHAHVSGEVLSLPLIVKHQIIVKTVDGHVYAFNRRTGEKQWVVDHGAPSLVLRSSSSPVVYENMILAGFSDGKLDAIDLETGRVVWQRSLGYASGSSEVERLADISADPLVRGGNVYLASYQGYAVSMSLKQGQFNWSKPASTYKNLSIDTHSLYMTDSHDSIWSINQHTGHVRWKQPALAARNVTEPVVMGRYVLVGDRTGFLHLLDAKHGDFVARHTLGSPVMVGPIVSSDHVYVMTASGQLHCFSVKG